jgi:hypothetical protein
VGAYLPPVRWIGFASASNEIRLGRSGPWSLVMSPDDGEASRMQTGGGLFGGKTKPWYRLQPGRAVLVAIGLYCCISIVLWFNDAAGHAIAVLYILPVALLAVTFGLWGGLSAAAAGFSLFALFEVFHSTGDIDVDGWIVRAVALLLLGGLLGRATDQIVASQRTALCEQRSRLQMEERQRRYSEAIEISDSLLQQMVAAKWMVEQGRSDEAAEVLEATIERGERMVAGLLPTRVSEPAVSPVELPFEDGVLHAGDMFDQ